MAGKSSLILSALSFQNSNSRKNAFLILLNVVLGISNSFSVQLHLADNQPLAHQSLFCVVVFSISCDQFLVFKFFANRTHNNTAHLVFRIKILSL